MLCNNDKGSCTVETNVAAAQNGEEDEVALLVQPVQQCKWKNSYMKATKTDSINDQREVGGTVDEWSGTELSMDRAWGCSENGFKNCCIYIYCLSDSVGNC